MSGNLASIMAEVRKQPVDKVAGGIPKPKGLPKPVVKVGKSRNPDFSKITCYVEETTRKEVARRLIDDGRELSEIVQVLLDGWASGKLHV